MRWQLRYKVSNTSFIKRHLPAYLAVLNDRWKLNAGVLYEHLSNGGQTDPNPSLNLIGPQIAITYSF